MGLQTVENLSSPSRILAPTGKVRQAASGMKDPVARRKRIPIGRFGFRVIAER